MMGVIFPYTSAQCSYLLAIQDNTKPITVVTGPAGSGKTQLACAEALGHRRIILTRPTLAADSLSVIFRAISMPKWNRGLDRCLNYSRPARGA